MEKLNALGSEISGYKSDKIIGERELLSTKNKMAESLLNGLGDDIKTTLSTPTDACYSNTNYLSVDKRSKIRKLFDKLIKVCN